MADRVVGSSDKSDVQRLGSRHDIRKHRLLSAEEFASANEANQTKSIERAGHRPVAGHSRRRDEAAASTAAAPSAATDCGQSAAAADETFLQRDAGYCTRASILDGWGLDPWKYVGGVKVLKGKYFKHGSWTASNENLTSLTIQLYTKCKNITRMALNRQHTSAKVADVAKLLLLSKRRPDATYHSASCGVWQWLHLTVTSPKSNRFFRGPHATFPPLVHAYYLNNTYLYFWSSIYIIRLKTHLFAVSLT